MIRAIDDYFLRQQEPIKSCLQFLREYILRQDQNITEAWRYGMPFYCYQGKPVCYLWIHKKYNQPYIGIVDGNRVHHPDLISEKRARMKIILVDPTQDISIERIDSILDEILALYN